MVKEGARATGWGMGKTTRKELKALGITFDPPNTKRLTYNVKVHYKTPEMRRPKQQKYEKDLETGKLYEKIDGEYEEISEEKYGQIVDEIGIERGDRKGQIGKPFKERDVSAPITPEPSDEPSEEEESDTEIEVRDINWKGKPYLHDEESNKIYDANTDEVVAIGHFVPYSDGNWLNSLGGVVVFDDGRPQEPESESESDDEVEVEDITHDGENYFHDEKTNIIYDPDSGLRVGMFVPYGDDEEWADSLGGRVVMDGEKEKEDPRVGMTKLEVIRYNDGMIEEDSSWTELATEEFEMGENALNEIYEEFTEAYRPEEGYQMPSMTFTDDQKIEVLKWMGKFIKYRWIDEPYYNEPPNIVYPELFELFPKEFPMDEDPRDEEEQAEAEEIFDDIETMKRRLRKKEEAKLAEAELIAKLKAEREMEEEKQRLRVEEERRIKKEERDEKIRIFEEEKEAKATAETLRNYYRRLDNRSKGRDEEDDGDGDDDDDDDEEELELDIGVNEDGLGTVEDTDFTEWSVEDAKTFYETIDDYADDLVDIPKWRSHLKKIFNKEDIRLDSQIASEVEALRTQMAKISESLKLLEDKTPIKSKKMGKLTPRNKVQLTSEQQKILDEHKRSMLKKAGIDI